MCVGLTEQEILGTLENAKDRFHKYTKLVVNLTAAQCDKALSDAIFTLHRLKKKGQMALKKDPTLKDKIDTTYNKLKELQRLGPEKVQLTLQFAEEWRYVD